MWGAFRQNNVIGLRSFNIITYGTVSTYGNTVSSSPLYVWYLSGNWLIFDGYLIGIWWIFDQYLIYFVLTLTIIRWIFDRYLTDILFIFDGYLIDIWWIFDYCLMDFSLISDWYLIDIRLIFDWYLKDLFWYLIIIWLPSDWYLIDIRLIFDIRGRVAFLKSELLASNRRKWAIGEWNHYFFKLLNAFNISQCFFYKTKIILPSVGETITF